MPGYNPLMNYWVVAGSSAQVFSSSSGDYVPVSNGAYQAWLTGGNLPSHIATEAGLGSVLAEFSARPVNVSVLDGFKDRLSQDTLDDIQFRWLFNLENRTRALEARPQVTVAQAKALIKSLI